MNGEWLQGGDQLLVIPINIFFKANVMHGLFISDGFSYISFHIFLFQKQFLVSTKSEQQNTCSKKFLNFGLLRKTEIKSNSNSVRK
jgi:hypothetical protein